MNKDIQKAAHFVFQKMALVWFVKSGKICLKVFPLLLKFFYRNHSEHWVALKKSPLLQTSCGRFGVFSDVSRWILVFKIRQNKSVWKYLFWCVSHTVRRLVLFVLSIASSSDTSKQSVSMKKQLLDFGQFLFLCTNYSVMREYCADKITVPLLGDYLTVI